MKKEKGSFSSTLILSCECCSDVVGCVQQPLTEVDISEDTPTIWLIDSSVISGIYSH